MRGSAWEGSSSRARRPRSTSAQGDTALLPGAAGTDRLTVAVPHRDRRHVADQQLLPRCVAAGPARVGLECTPHDFRHGCVRTCAPPASTSPTSPGTASRPRSKLPARSQAQLRAGAPDHRLNGPGLVLVAFAESPAAKGETHGLLSLGRRFESCRGAWRVDERARKFLQSTKLRLFEYRRTCGECEVMRQRRRLFA